MVLETFFSILVNGSPSQPFHPSRGIRKGDPISPFFFAIMAEDLSWSITSAMHENKIIGLQPHASNPSTTHQQFVDNTLLMGLPSIKEVASFMSILSDFSATSSTSINPLKSKLFFFNTLFPIYRNISRFLTIPISSLPSTYLGVPLTDRPLSRATWENLLNKLEKILANWTFISLNLVGRLILVKSVLQAIPLYMYMALAAPKLISNKIGNL